MKYLITTFVLLFAVVATAQGHLDVQTVVQKETVVVNEAGESEAQLVAAELVVPGETVFYTITFTNVGAEPADNIVITNPIAEDLMYVDGSAFGAGMDILFSVDGGVTFAAAERTDGCRRRRGSGCTSQRLHARPLGHAERS